MKNDKSECLRVEFTAARSGEQGQKLALGFMLMTMISFAFLPR